MVEKLYFIIKRGLNSTNGVAGEQQDQDSKHWHMFL